ncbi:hypothetical protein QAD02_007661 [Eretmocerus hayati]|uniref:Uncharacterized protein n=1 Tax=Eretmocerus hayati TaxID=131215 RepID=A0ACC2N4N2_9HYME|nr:hypothetical protein QAD02_007661 [Eretmocerus hayati]
MNSGKDNRFNDALEIMVNEISKYDENSSSGEEEVTMIECIEYLSVRQLKTRGVDPDRKNEIKAIKRLMEGEIAEDLVEKFCTDELALNIICLLINHNISIKEIIRMVMDNESEAIAETIPILFDNKAEITEDLTLKQSTDEHEISPVTITNQSVLHFVEGRGYPGGLTSTPRSFLNQTSNMWRPVHFDLPGHNHQTQNNLSYLAPIRNLSIKDAIELNPKYNGFNIPLMNFLEGCREACNVIPAINEPDLAKLIKMARIGKTESLEDATAQAIKIEREFNLFEPEELTETVRILNEARVKKDDAASVLTIGAREVEVFQYCEKRGHTARTCWSIPGMRQVARRVTFGKSMARDPAPRLTADAQHLAPASEDEPLFDRREVSRRTNAVDCREAGPEHEQVCHYCRQPGH